MPSRDSDISVEIIMISEYKKYIP